MFLAAFTPLLELVAFVLLLLVSLSTPIIKRIYLFKLNANVDGFLNSSAKANIRFGAWGYCYSGVQAAVAGFDTSTGGGCTKAKLGYKIDYKVAELLGIDDSLDAISRTVTTVLILHPIACALAFLAFLCSLLLLRRRAGISRGAALATLIATLLAALLATAVFLLDVVLVAVVRSHVRDQTDGAVSLTWGNAVWMALGATVALWLALLGAACGLFQVRRARRTGAAKNPATVTY